MGRDLQSINLDTEAMEWAPGFSVLAQYGKAASWCKSRRSADRRADGEGAAYTFHFTPPTDKVIRIVAVARSDEDIINLQGGRGSRGRSCGSRAITD